MKLGVQDAQTSSFPTMAGKERAGWRESRPRRIAALDHEKSSYAGKNLSTKMFSLRNFVAIPPVPFLPLTSAAQHNAS